MLLVGLAGFGVAALTGLALAKSFTLTVDKNVKVAGKTENVVANSHGVVVYTLSGETTHHLLCTKAKGCLAFWFPVKATTKLTAAPGIKGKLGRLHRDGLVQVTLSGHPLYTFKLDGGKKNVATGEGIPSFGGTWHVIVVKSSSHTTSTGTTTTSTTMTTSTTPCPYPPCY
jgi:predicted lipoprotein with Yx(FWY)xxD motif